MCKAFLGGFIALENYDSIGRLYVKVSTAQGAIPVKDAVVFVTPYVQNGSSVNETYSLRTNEDGLTQILELSAPAKSLSLSPGSKIVPYSEYVLTVKKEGYKNAQLIGIPVFDGITSIQNIFLIPLTEDELLNGGGVDDIYYENDGYVNLRSDTVDVRRGNNI